MSKILDFCLAQVGKPYVFGRSGPDSFDCSGLTKRAVAQIGLDWYHGATTQWLRGKQAGASHQYAYFSETGPIQDLPNGQIAFLFNQDAKSTSKLVMAHTGIYDGAGYVVQAGGYGGRGVHYNPLDKRRWTHYAVLSQFWTDKDGEVMDTNVLRRGSIGEAVRDLQTALMALGYDVGRVTQADGKFGPATEAGVKAFQRDYGLQETGTWGADEQARLDEIMKQPPVEPPTEPPVDKKALLTELEGLNKRQAVIIAALKGVV